MFFRPYILLTIACAAFMHCAVDHVAVGGGSDVGNGIFIGEVKNSDGTPAAFAKVLLFPAQYNPVADSAHTGYCIDTADSIGAYRLKNVRFGEAYRIIARNVSCSTCVLITNVSLSDSQTQLETVVLSRPGAIKIVLPDTTGTDSGYVYIPGTDISEDIPGGLTRQVVLHSVPTGKIPEICLAYRKKASVRTIRYDVYVKSSDSITLFRTLWQHARSIGLNTTVSGAGVFENVTGFPVLVRLNSGNFVFSRAKAGGFDIRFTKSDDVPLAYEIERWDSAGNSAEIWVKTDTVFGNDSGQSILMYWGNPSAADSSSGRAVFDTADGFVGVWHLSNNRADTVEDATADSYTGTPVLTSSISGAIGLSRYFNGSTSYIEMKNTAYGKLDLAANGKYSMSLWAYADTIDTLWHAIAGKGHEKYYMQFKCFSGGKSSWEFVEFANKIGWEYSEDSTTEATGKGTWVYLTGVSSGTHQQLYINGELARDTFSLMSGNYAVNDSDNFMIGRYPRSVTLPYKQGLSYFKGSMDEVRVSTQAYSASWIKLCYMNQRADDKLTIFR